MSRPVAVTIVRGRLDHLARQRDWLARASDTPPAHVVVVMGGPDPASVLSRPGPPVERIDLDVDGPLPLAEARNLGVARALDLDAHLAVLLDVDVLPLDGLMDAYVDAARAHPGDVLLGPVRHLGRDDDPEHPDAWVLARPDPRDPGADVDGNGLELRPELLWSLSMAFTPSTWARLGGFHEDYVGYGAEDTDLGMVAASRDVTLRWVPQARGLHQWHGTGPVAERAADLVRNARTYHDRWGDWPMQDWLHELHGDGHLHFDPRRDQLHLPAVTPDR